MSAATVTVIYPQGTKFDMSYYKSTHMPLVQAKWGLFGLKSWKIIKFLEDAAYTVQATLEFENMKTFRDAASSPEGEDILGDIKNYSDKEPIIMAGEVQFTSLD